MKKTITLLSILMLLNIAAYSFTGPYGGNWRWRANDGNEINATYLADENRTIAITNKSELRVRVEIYDNETDTNNFRISFYSLQNSNTAKIISLEDTSDFKFYNSEFFEDSDSTNNELLTSFATGPHVGSFMFDQSVENIIFMGDDERKEIEYCIVPADSIKDYSKYYFFIIDPTDTVSINSFVPPALYTLFASEQAGIADIAPKSSTSAKIKLNAGNGIGRCAFISEGNNTPLLPYNGLNYNADSLFGQGDTLSDPSWFCVYNDTLENEFVVSDLTHNMLYTVAIFEYFIIENDTVYMPSTINNSMTFTSGVYSQAISFPNIPTKTINDDDFFLGATSNVGLEITYSLDNNSVITVLEGIAHIIGAGTVNITASNTGNDSVLAATPVIKTLIITGNSDMDEHQKNKTAELYPNPVINGELYIEGLDANSITELQIFDIKGRVVLNKIISNENSIDVSNLPKGIYIVSLKSDKTINSLKLIIE